MRKIKKYEDFINEEINWRKGLAGAAIAGILNLTSCEQPIKQKSKDFDNKIPKIENLVQNHINSDGESDFIELIDIRGPYGEKEFNNDSLEISNPFRKYYIISKIKNQNGEEVYSLLLYIDIQNFEEKNVNFLFDIPIKMNSSGLSNFHLQLSNSDYEFKNVYQIDKSIIEAERNQKILIEDGFVKLHFSSFGFVNRDCELTQFGELHICYPN